MFLLNRNLLTNPVILRLCCGSGPDKTFTTWRYSFDLLLVPIEKVYKAPAKLVIGALIAHFWCLCQKLSLFTVIKLLLHKSSEWSSLVSGPWSKFCPLEATNPTPFTISYQQVNQKSLCTIFPSILNYKNEAFLSLGVFRSSVAFYLHFLLSPTY